MCKMKDVSVGIKDMDFKTYREKWMVLDDQYFTFENMTRVYSVLDLLKSA